MKPKTLKIAEDPAPETAPVPTSGLYEGPFRVLFYESGMGICLVDLERRILDINPAFERMMGYTVGELKGKTFAGLMYPEDDALNLTLHTQLLSGERNTYHMDRRYIRKNGTILWTRLTVSLLRDKAGKPEMTMGIVEDITEKKQAEQKLMEQQHQLAQSSKMTALGEMAGGIAHEINNPLNVVQFRAQQIMTVAKGLSDSQIATKISENAENIDKNVKRIYSIVKGLQAFARKADQDPFETVSLNWLIDEAIDLVKERFRYQNVDLRVTRASDGVDVECRPTQILQVLVNLLNNAFDAVQALPEKWVGLEVRDVGHAVEILVTDSGNGIPEDVSAKMFTTFYTTKPAGKGTGLGLSISKGIMESHRGLLKLDRECKNTRFVLGLPKRQSSAYLKFAA